MFIASTPVFTSFTSLGQFKECCLSRLKKIVSESLFIGMEVEGFVVPDQ